MKSPSTLTPEEVDQFIYSGYIKLSDCFDIDLAASLVHKAYQRLGYDPDDPSTWKREIDYLDHHNKFPIRDIAPRAWGAICDVLGGENRLRRDVFSIGRTIHFSSVDSFKWSDAFIINFKYGATSPWKPPSADTSGWHIDGGYFRHFLDSPEQALLIVAYWTDVDHKGGGTFVAPDSVTPVAHKLLEHTEGIDFSGFGDLVSECRNFQELVGKAGDVFICHPFVLHTSSPNHSNRPRFMSNPPIALQSPMCFNRKDPKNYSPLEYSILQALKVDRLDFRPTGRRELLFSESLRKRRMTS